MIVRQPDDGSLLDVSDNQAHAVDTPLTADCDDVVAWDGATEGHHNG